MRLPRWIRVAFGSIGLSLLVGCGGPSYRMEQTPEAIQQICTKDYRLQVSAKRIGQTVAVHLQHGGVLEQQDGQIRLAASANEVLGNAIEAIHRVLLSSDNPNGFYLLLVSDPSIPGIYLMMVRYLDDVKRVHTSSITPTEFFSRTILQLQPANPSLTSLNQIALHDITLEQFLSWQLSKRLQDRLTEHTQREGLSQVSVGPCVGEFKNGEFAFTLNVVPETGGTLPPEVVDQVFQEATTLIAKVLSDYRFNQFQAIRLIHPTTGRNLLLPKQQLDIFR
ncbi:MAG: hypothetical protein HY595_03545 [Candidatus Omnitrophica bacterium]|nr:hypothetical protein [Candidatus Omnitrophota bacterium]